MKKIFSISALMVFAYPAVASAICPVCTVAVGAGVGLAQWLGIDDSISGVWLGGLAVSLIIWTINWLDTRGSTLRNSDNSVVGRKRLNLGRNFLVVASYYALIVGPLYWQGFIAKNPLNTICGIDKLLFGLIIGSILFIAGVSVHNYLFKRNENKSYFKGQKIVAAIVPLVIVSIILYFTC